jgi:cytochrome b561
VDIFGVPVGIWHGLVVEEHTGIAVFIILALVVRILTDLFVRGPNPSSRVQITRQGTDFLSYWGSLAVVFFLILSGVTGYLIQPYSMLVESPLLINKSLMALAALFFWSAFFAVRFMAGPGLWQKRGLYLVEVVTALLGIFFTAITASVGAEITVGQSALEPVYRMLGFSWNTFLVQPLEVEITAGLIVVGVVLALVIPVRKAKPI